MNKVVPLVMFGLALIVGGLYYGLWNDSTEYLDDLVINDAYYELISFGWRMIPAAILIVGIMCLIAAGVMVRNTRREEIY